MLIGNDARTEHKFQKFIECLRPIAFDVGFLSNLRNSPIFKARNIHFDKSKNALNDILKEAKHLFSCQTCRVKDLKSVGCVKERLRFRCGNCGISMNAMPFLKMFPAEIIILALKTFPEYALYEVGCWFQLFPETEIMKNRKDSKAITFRRNKTKRIHGNDAVSQAVIDFESSEDFHSEEVVADCIVESITEITDTIIANAKANIGIKFDLTKDDPEDWILLSKEELLEKLRKARIQLIDAQKGLEQQQAVSKKSYADIATPRASPSNRIKEMVAKQGPIEKHEIEAVLSPKRASPDFEYSDMELLFFGGVKRTSISFYRKILSQNGFEKKALRDITFLTDDIVQIATYGSLKEDLVRIFTGIVSSIKHLENFDPTKKVSYGFSIESLSDEVISKKYFATIQNIYERISQQVTEFPFLRRTANFFEKIFATKNIRITSGRPQKRFFFMNEFVSQNYQVEQQSLLLEEQ
jgi:hypothetical protein